MRIGCDLFVALVISGNGFELFVFWFAGGLNFWLSFGGVLSPPCKSLGGCTFGMPWGINFDVVTKSAPLNVPLFA